MRAYILTFLALCSFPPGTNGDTTDTKQADTTKKKATPAWIQYCKDRTKQYKIYPLAEANQPFRRLPQPMMLHTQPVRGDQLGTVQLWIDKSGKPAAVGTTIIAPETWSPGDTYYVIEEFHSLYDEAIRGRVAGRDWECPHPGLKWKKLVKVDAPKDKFVMMTSQARRIAKEFAGRAIDHHSENQVRPLRMQSNPVYKYELTEDPNNTVAGFMFAACLGTDPDVFLCLEVRNSETAKQWHYALASFSDMRVIVDRKGKQVWESARPWGPEHIGTKTVSGLTLEK